MKRSKTALSILATVVIAGAFATSSARAELIIDFGGNMVSSNSSLVLPSATTTGTIRTWGYDFDTPISPSSGYSGPAFYGVLQNESGKATAANLGRARISNNTSGSNDELQIRGNNDSDDGVDNVITGLIFFKPDLEPGEWVEFKAGDSISKSHHTISLSGSPRLERAAVLNDGTWYLSQFSSNNSWSIADVTTVNWAVWDPTDTPLDPTPSLTFNTSGSSFTNVQAVGVWFAMARDDGAPNAEARFHMSGFQVNATVIPEPHTLGLLLAAGALLAMRRRKT